MGPDQVRVVVELLLHSAKLYHHGEENADNYFVRQGPQNLLLHL
jgi:hypothetical protein